MMSRIWDCRTTEWRIADCCTHRVFPRRLRPRIPPEKRLRPVCRPVPSSLQWRRALRTRPCR
eukprot:15156941-Alexandrium_andersonii.AAC.1